MRPLIRWAGSKRALIPQLRNLAPTTYTRYVEPFAGSACLFFALSPVRAVIGDINAQLITTYEVLRDTPEALHSAVIAAPGDAATYYAARSMDPSKMTPLDAAARFLYLNRYSFNGIYRTNRQGQFNVPFGRSPGAVPSNAEFQEAASMLRVADLCCCDFAECLEGTGVGDFVYIDPPYSRSQKPHYGLYGYDGFSPLDVTRLIVAVKEAEQRGASFILSIDRESLPDAIPPTWAVTEAEVTRRVAARVADRHTTTELLVSNVR